MNASIGFIFPGQGSQHVGMLGELADAFPSIKDTFHCVSDHVGYDVWFLVQEGPEERLNQTEQTQVAMLTADIAVYNLLQQQCAINPTMLAGHSLGEYAALVAADAIPLVEAAALVAHRGRLMQQYVPLGQGAMAAIVGLSDETILALCAEASHEQEEVSPANFNAIGQVVIAGHARAVERAIVLAEHSDARMAKRIPVSVPCHCPMLRDAADDFAEYLQRAPFRTPSRPVISNVDVSIYESPEQIRATLKAQLYSPVRWVEIIQLMSERGVKNLVETGPGKVLSGLVKRIDKSIEVCSIYDSTSLNQATAWLEKGLKKEIIS